LDHLRDYWRPIRNFRPDALFVSMGFPYEFQLVVGLTELVKSLGVPYVLICHAYREENALKEQVRHEAVEFFTSAAEVGFVANRMWKAVERQLATRLVNASLVHNPPNLNDCSPVQWPTECKEPSFAFVGRVEVAKGIDVLFQTLGHRKWRERRFRLRLYGDISDRGHFVRLASMFGLTDRVEFHGFVSDVRSIWAKNHVFVLPSQREAAPLSLVEAMLCARPSVVTDVGDMASWIEEGVSGFVAQAPHEEYLDAALERAWIAREYWPRMGQCAHERAECIVKSNLAATLLETIVKAGGWSDSSEQMGRCAANRAVNDRSRLNENTTNGCREIVCP
jgi:glycosyltransferase involved in cell wall biosynthesis